MNHTHKDGSPSKHHRHPHPEFQGSMTVGEKGQVVIPAETRKVLGLAKGSRLLAFRVGDVFVAATLETLEKIATKSGRKAEFIRELLKTIR